MGHIKSAGKMSLRFSWVVISIIALTMLLGGCGSSVIDESSTTVGNQTETSSSSASAIENEDSVNLGETTSSQTSNKDPEELGLVAATVQRVVDGDTFVLSDNSRVRLIGVNTPESTNRIETYGKEASNYTKSRLEGKTVYLQKDVSETDRYGRLLRIVWLEVPTDVMDEKEIRSKMFNAELVLNGYAEPSTYPPDVTYSEYFVKFAREAREQEVGLWKYGEDGTTKGDLDSNSNSSKSSTSSSSTSSNQSTTDSFKNCTELRKVYPSGVSSDHPAYQSEMDRDHDGMACE